MSITGDLKKKLVLSILNTFAKTGAYIRQINTGFENETGEKLAPTKLEAEEYMNTLSEVYKHGELYFSQSEKSAHIIKMVAEQNTKISPNYRGQTARNFQNFNTSFPGRQPISYKNDYVDVNVQRPTVRAGKIGNRRKTCGGPSYSVSSSSETEARKRRAATPDRASKRPRSRSRSPARRFERSPPRRYRSRSRSRSSPRRSGRSISPRYSPPRRRVDRSPPRDRRSNSPRNKRSSSPQEGRSRSPIKTRASRRSSKSPVRWPDSKQNNARSSATNGAEKSDNKDNIKHSETKPAQTNDIKSEIKPNIKPKKFRFTVIGDGYIYYMLSDMQSDVKFNLSMCNHTLTLADAIKMVEVQQKTLQMKKRKVLIAIGATDLRNGRSFRDIKRDFTTLFMRCDELELKPLITTIICFDSPELKTKADIYNKFLIECFENVVVMGDVMKIGLADVMTSMNKKNAMKLNRNSLGLGTRQQLILNVPKE